MRQVTSQETEFEKIKSSKNAYTIFHVFDEKLAINFFFYRKKSRGWEFFGSKKNLECISCLYQQGDDE